MSHIVTVKCQVKDLAGLQAACRRFGLPMPVDGTHKMFSRQTATGYAVKLKGWSYPAVFDLAKGEVHADTFNGRWGDQAEYDRFVQGYAAEVAKAQLRRKGYNPIETQRADGTIVVTCAA